MKIDSFVKVTLVLIVVFLGIIALKPILQPEGVIAASGGKFDYIQNWSGLKDILIFDSRTGDLWGYSGKALIGKEAPYYVGRLTELGKPFAKPK